MGKSQTLVSLAERGLVWTGEAYRLDVLKACALPASWKPKLGLGEADKAGTLKSKRG